MKKEQKVKLREALAEIGYEYCDNKNELANIDGYTLIFQKYSNIVETCSKCFLANKKNCLPCRSWERETGDNGYYRYYSKRQEFDVTERRKRSNISRMKNKEKGGDDE